MKKYSWILLLTLMLASCNRGAAGPEGTELDTEPPPGTESGEVLPSVSMPDHPDADLAENWLPNDLVPVGVEYEETFREAEKEILTASGVFPQTGIAAIDDYYENTRNDFRLLSEARAEVAKVDLMSYQIEAGYQIEINAGGIFSVSRTLHQYLGGAHGSTDIFCETFSVSSGERLQLDDFFTVERDVYTARMLEYVYAEIDQNPDNYWPDAKTIALELFPYDTFCVTPNGISLLFPEYNIASYAQGTVRIDVPWGALAEFFKLPN